MKHIYWQNFRHKTTKKIWYLKTTTKYIYFTIYTICKS